MESQTTAIIDDNNRMLEDGHDHGKGEATEPLVAKSANDAAILKADSGELNNEPNRIGISMGPNMDRHIDLLGATRLGSANHALSLGPDDLSERSVLQQQQAENEKAAAGSIHSDKTPQNDGDQQPLHDNMKPEPDSAEAEYVSPHSPSSIELQQRCRTLTDYSISEMFPFMEYFPNGKTLAR